MRPIVGLDQYLAHQSKYEQQHSNDDKENSQQRRKNIVGHFPALTEQYNGPNSASTAQ